MVEGEGTGNIASNQGPHNERTAQKVCSLWHSIRPTTPVPAVVSYSVRIHSLCCLCCDSSVHSPLQNEFSTEIDLLLRISISRIIPHPKAYPVAAYFLFFVLIFTLCFSKVYYKELLLLLLLLILLFHYY